MASTPVFGLPYPDDYQQPADSPNALHALALAVESALSYVQSWVGNGFAYKDHTQLPNSAGIGFDVWAVGTLGPGQEAEVTIEKPEQSAVFVTVEFQSTWIVAVADVLDPTHVRLRCRNTTQATTHNNINVAYLIVQAG